MSIDQHHTGVQDTLDQLLTTTGQEALLLHDPSGVIHFASQAASQILGVSSVHGKNLLELIHSGDVIGVRVAFRDVVLRGTLVSPQTVRIGNRFVVLSTMPVKDIHGAVIELQSTVRDVTEFIAFRDQIVAQDAVSAAASEMAKVGGWRYEVATDELFWTDETLRILEVPPGFEPTLQSGIGFYAERHQPVVRHAIQTAIERAERQDIEAELITYAKRYIWVRVSIKPEVVHGTVVRIYGAFQDITEHHQREEQLRRLISELTKQRDQLEEFAYVISHHLRGPVSNIVSLLNDLDSEKNTDIPNETVKHLRASSNHLLDTLEDLTHAIIVRHDDSPNYESLEVELVIKSVTNALRDLISASGTNISIDVRSQPILEYPRAYLESILRQLLSNSIRFSAPGRPPRIRIRMTHDETGPILEFSDNGLGIDLEKYGNKIFRVRTSFHRGAAGRGVGLFMIKTIVESMGGSVTLTSMIDKGTTFTIAFTNANGAGSPS